MQRAGTIMLAALIAAMPGTAVATGAVAVLDRAVDRGELLRAADFTASTDISEAVARGALSADQADGLEARRALRPGSVVRGTDVTEPRLVRRGEPVTIRLVSGRLAITAMGRALSDGAAGERVRVVTNETSRTLDAVVDGTGSVRLNAF